jgi:ADP-L-glycero-D-manno-heptose 6-epimerase
MFGPIPDTYDKNKLPVVITGGFGFIGSNLIEFLNNKGIIPYVIENWNKVGDGWRNVLGLKYHTIGLNEISFSIPVRIIHLGASVDTTERMSSDLWDNNVNFVKLLLKNFPYNSSIIYASSAATYGAEENDFSERIVGLKPLNAYGFTKLELDKYLIITRGGGVGLRFFNVYGPREDYKGNMASVIYKGLKGPLAAPAKWELFRSYRDNVKDGEQKRDFVYVEDVCKVIYHFMTNDETSGGIYNVGSGTARSFNDLVRILNPKKQITYINIPENLRSQYQYYTCADLKRLRQVGYTESFLSLEEGIAKTKEFYKL